MKTKEITKVNAKMLKYLLGEGRKQGKSMNDCRKIIASCAAIKCASADFDSPADKELMKLIDSQFVSVLAIERKYSHLCIGVLANSVANDYLKNKATRNYILNDLPFSKKEHNAVPKIPSILKEFLHQEQIDYIEGYWRDKWGV